MARIVTLTPNPALDYAVEAEKIEPNRKLRCQRPRTDPGGGGVNVARAAARLGAETLAIFTAGGTFGRALAEGVAREHVPARIVPVGGDTRITFHAKETASGDEYRFGLPGAPLAREELDALLDALADEAREGDFVVGSGSLPPGAPSYFYARAAAIAKAKGARFVLDTTDGVEEALEEGVFLLRLNNADAEHLAKGPIAWPEGAAAFALSVVRGAGAEMVVMSKGGEGGLVASAKGAALAPSIKVEAQSAVGAGDSFVAAFLVALLRGVNEEEALRYGMAGAAATIMSPGTALFDPRDVERLFRTV